jgi:hypothetical protein
VVKTTGRRANPELEMLFQEGQRSLSRDQRLSLLAWMQRRRKGQGNGHPLRDFWLVTPSGRWERL